MDVRLLQGPLRPIRVYGKSPLPSSSGPLVAPCIKIPNVIISVKPEAAPFNKIQHVIVKNDHDYDDDMIEAVECAAGDSDYSDRELEIDSGDADEHVLHRIRHEDEDTCSQGSRLSAAGDDLGSQGTGSGNKSTTTNGTTKSRYRRPATAEKRRRRQEEVNRAVQQCRLKRKAMLADMKEELDQLQATYKRLKLRSKNLDVDKDWPVFEPKPYPPELESRRHTRRGARYRAESEEERRERVRKQNNEAQYRKALRNKCDEDNMRNEIEFLRTTNSTMRSFIHNHLRSKRIHSSENSSL